MPPGDIAIAGCGPAGLTAALLLTQAGQRVTLFDRFPAPGPVGSGLMLQPSGMAVIERLGLTSQVMSRSARIDRLLGLSASGRTVLDARYDELPGPPSYGLGIHRASLFEVLHEAVATAGIPLEPGREAVGSTLDERGRWLQFADGSRAGPFDLVIDATGLHTPLAPRCGR